MPPGIVGPAGVVQPTGPPVYPRPKADSRGVFYKQQFETDPLATIFDGAVGTTASIDSSEAKFGGRSLLVDQTGTASESDRNIPTVNQASNVLVGRLWFRVDSVPGVLEQLVNVNGGVNFRLDWTTTGTIQCGWQAALIDSGISGTKRWRSWDFRADYRGTTWTLDWMIDGVAQTQSTKAAAGTPAGQIFKFASTGATTIRIRYDGWQLSDNYNDYPLQDAPSWAPFVPSYAFWAGSMPKLGHPALFHGTGLNSLLDSTPPAQAAPADVVPMVPLIQREAARRAGAW